MVVVRYIWNNDNDVKVLNYGSRIIKAVQQPNSTHNMKTFIKNRMCNIQ